MVDLKCNEGCYTSSIYYPIIVVTNHCYSGRWVVEQPFKELIHFTDSA